MRVFVVELFEAVQPFFILILQWINLQLNALDRFSTSFNAYIKVVTLKNVLR